MAIIGTAEHYAAFIKLLNVEVKVEDHTKAAVELTMHHLAGGNMQPLLGLASEARES